MSDSMRENRGIRGQLRAYLLDTLPETERAELESRLAGSEDLRTQLEAERAALAKLDALQEVQPGHDLAAQVMGEIHDREAKKRLKGPMWRRRLLQSVAVLAIVLTVSVVFLHVLERPREASRLASSANNLKQIGLIMKMYANESKGEFFPPLAPQEGVWGIDVSVLYPQYLTDPQILIAPQHPRAAQLREEMDAAMNAAPIDWAAVNRLAAESYTYIGWAATNTEELARLKEARPQSFAGRMQLAQSFEADTRIYRLREGIERFFITDLNNPAASAGAQSEIPVMFETYPSRPRGRNVLYMDGHVQFVRYGEAFPVTDETDRILGIEPAR